VEYAIKVCISFIPVVLFFWLYQRHFVFERALAWQSKALFLGLLSSVLAIVIQQTLPTTNSIAIRAFGYAAIVEESIRYTLLFIRIRKSSDSFTVIEGVFDGILVALGFAFAENLHYSVSSPGYVILLRCLSSVPIHVFCGGVMAYFLSYRELCRKTGPVWRINLFGARRWLLGFVAFLLPVLLHGAFDYAIFRGGVWNYSVVVLLVIGFTFLEYLIAQARLIFGKNVLEVLGLDADDMQVIARQRDYEKWISTLQDESRDRVPLFVNRWDSVRTSIGICLGVVAAVFALLRATHPHILLSSGLDWHAEIALTILLQSSIAFLLLCGDKINYLFIDENMMRVPLTTLIAVYRQKRAGEEESRLDTMALDILPRGAFLSGMDELKTHEKVRLEILREREEPVRVSAKVQWVNKHNRHLPSGSLVQFTKPGPGFLIFTARFRIHKVIQRLRNAIRQGTGS